MSKPESRPSHVDIFRAINDHFKGQGLAQEGVASIQPVRLPPEDLPRQGSMDPIIHIEKDDSHYIMVPNLNDPDAEPVILKVHLPKGEDPGVHIAKIRDGLAGH